MFTYAKIALLLLQFVQYLVKRADERRLISQGERNQVLASLDTVRGMVTDGNKIEQATSGMSDDAVSRELSDLYGSDPGPGEPGHGGSQPQGGVVLPDKQDDPGGAVEHSGNRVADTARHTDGKSQA